MLASPPPPPAKGRQESVAASKTIPSPSEGVTAAFSFLPKRSKSPIKDPPPKKSLPMVVHQ